MKAKEFDLGPKVNKRKTTKNPTMEDINNEYKAMFKTEEDGPKKKSENVKKKKRNSMKKIQEEGEDEIIKELKSYGKSLKQ
jgi:hypothetical protein